MARKGDTNFKNVHTRVLISFIYKAKSSAADEYKPLLEHDDVQLCLSSLMPDWFDPQGNFYDLGNKITSNVFLKLLEIADRRTYASVCLRIAYQYFHETNLVIDDCKEVKGLFHLEDIFKLKNRSFKIDLLKLMVVHWRTDDFPLNYDEVEKRILNLSELDDTWKSFFTMAFLLHENHLQKFEFELVKSVKSSKEKFGDFHEYIIMPDLPLLFIIMKRLDMQKTIDFTFAQCPYMKYNSTIVDVLRKSQEHQRFILAPFDDEGLSVSLLHQILTSINQFFLQEKIKNVSFLEHTLKNFKNLAAKEAEILKKLFFGWRIRQGHYEENFLERNLMQSENDRLIGLIWNTFKLWQKGFILTMVRQFSGFPATSNSNFSTDKSCWQTLDRLHRQFRSQEPHYCPHAKLLGRVNVQQEEIFPHATQPSIHGGSGKNFV
jgi:hypothetical protein